MSWNATKGFEHSNGTNGGGDHAGFVGVDPRFGIFCQSYIPKNEHET